MPTVPPLLVPPLGEPPLGEPPELDPDEPPNGAAWPALPPEPTTALPAFPDCVPPDPVFEPPVVPPPLLGEPLVPAPPPLPALLFGDVESSIESAAQALTQATRSQTND